MKTLEQRRDSYKEHCRPIIQKTWTEYRAAGGDVTTEGRREFRDLLIFLTLPSITAVMLAGGHGEQGEGDAVSVLDELIEELPTLEMAN